MRHSQFGNIRKGFIYLKANTVSEKSCELQYIFSDEHNSKVATHHQMIIDQISDSKIQVKKLRQKLAAKHSVSSRVLELWSVGGAAERLKDSQTIFLQDPKFLLSVKRVTHESVCFSATLETQSLLLLLLSRWI